MEGLGRPSDPPVAKLLLGPAAYVPCCTAAKLPLVRLSCRAANLPSSTWMFPLRLQKTLLFPWESADGRDIIEEAFRVSHVRTHFRTRPALGAPDPDGWRGREHVSWLFMNDDDEAQQRIINNLMLPYATGDFHPDYLHEHAGGRVSAFLKPDGVRVRPIGCASVWRRGTATLICKYVRKDASAYLTGSCPNFIQTAGSRDGATICAKLVSLIHDLPQDPEDPGVICQIDFENAFQMPPRQLCVGDCILGKASRTYDNGSVQVGDDMPHLAALKPFFEYFRSMSGVASRNRYTDHHGTTHYIEGTAYRGTSWRC